MHVGEVVVGETLDDLGFHLSHPLIYLHKHVDVLVKQMFIMRLVATKIHDQLYISLRFFFVGINEKYTSAAHKSTMIKIKD